VTTGADLAAEARTYLGVAWRHQGRSRQGVDCLGLVREVGHSFGLIDFDTRDYSRQATDESMLEQCRELLLPVADGDWRVGDVPVMRFGTNRHIGFFGDYLYGGLSLIHSYSRFPRRVVEHRFDNAWLRSHEASLLEVFRFPGVTA
jgi:cell wall-associated NlpC family hydrolase